MIITGAFFAEYVRASEGKLDVLGGVLDTWTTRLGEQRPLALVMLLQRGPDDLDGPFAVKITVRDSSGEPIRVGDGERREADAILAHFEAGTVKGENGFVYAFPSLAFERPGRHAFMLELDYSTTTVPLTIVAAE